MMVRFEPGKTYTGRKFGDSDCVICVRVISRTPKTARVLTDWWEHVFRISEHTGVEIIKWGNYPMAPRVFADRVQP
jgi:regulator of RNase E activity RraB